MEVLVVYNLPAEKQSADDLDVLVQVEAVSKSLHDLGHSVSSLGADLNLASFQQKVSRIKPDAVFNLVEALNGVERYMHFVPSILEAMNIPFTGASAESLFTTTDKVFTKKLFDYFDIRTPRWQTFQNISNGITVSVPCIIKPISVDASVGLDDTSVVFDKDILTDELSRRSEKFGECFLENYIDGREFNISVIETAEGPLILPIAEIRFENYPEEKLKIVNYDAKWNDKSFEYENTVRHFDFEQEDEELLVRLKNISELCWNKFHLKGYARVDVRVDKNGNAFVLEINANPCISPDSGFAAAALQHGWDYTRMIETIINLVSNQKK